MTENTKLEKPYILLHSKQSRKYKINTEDRFFKLNFPSKSIKYNPEIGIFEY